MCDSIKKMKCVVLFVLYKCAVCVYLNSRLLFVWIIFKAWSSGGPRSSWQLSIHLSSAGSCLMFSLTYALLVCRPQGGFWTLALHASCTSHAPRRVQSHAPHGGSDDWWATLQPQRRLSCISCSMCAEETVQFNARTTGV